MSKQLVEPERVQLVLHKKLIYRLSLIGLDLHTPMGGQSCSAAV